ncbi:hypothetical protein [Acidocella sp.]|uniref:hypothetical protein n=1 Tax=Acidocella sp. TaxID=50710 RepID=UPI003CFF6112
MSNQTTDSDISSSAEFFREPICRPGPGIEWYEWDDENENITDAEGTSFGIEYRDGKTLIWNIEDERLAMIFPQILSLNTVAILGLAYGIGWADGCSFGRASPQEGASD